MDDKRLSGLPPLSSPSHQNGRIGGMASPKRSPPANHNGSLEVGAGSHHGPSNTSGGPQPHSAPCGRASASSSPLRALRALGGLVTPAPGPCAEESCSTRPRGQSLASALSSRIRTTRNKHKSSQQEEPEALLDLILECQGQRLDDQRASLSLLPEPGPAVPCGACSPDQLLPSLDFYYMLIHYQSDRMEDQRCSLPDLDDVVGSLAAEGQEDFFSLLQRVQSRRMDEQRASLTHTEKHDQDTLINNTHTAGSSPPHHLHHHNNNHHHNHHDHH